MNLTIKDWQAKADRAPAKDLIHDILLDWRADRAHLISALEAVEKAATNALLETVKTNTHKRNWDQNKQWLMECETAKRVVNQLVNNSEPVLRIIDDEIKTTSLRLERP